MFIIWPLQYQVVSLILIALAARALLNWSQEDLAKKASLTMTPISRLERKVVDTRKGTMKLITMALEEAGIEFINEKGGGGKVEPGLSTATIIGERPLKQLPAACGCPNN